MTLPKYAVPIYKTFVAIIHPKCVCKWNPPEKALYGKTNRKVNKVRSTIFSKIAKIDHLLDDEEVEAIFVGFKPIYKKIKVELADAD